MLARGFGLWRRRPGVMRLGLLPAAIAFVVLAAALVALGLSLPGLVGWATPFADGWDAGWRTALRVSAGILVLAGAGALAAVSFTALALVLGDPFYERIRHAVEAELGALPPGTGGFWRTVADSLQLLGLGAGAAILSWAVGLVPVIGPVVGGALGFVLTAGMLARELTARTFEAHGVPLAERRRLLRTRRWRVLGLGAATQLCFLVPFGAIPAMPAAVAGATMLARELLAEDAAGRSRP